MKRIIITSVAAIGLAWSGAAFAQTQTPQYNSGGASAPVGQQVQFGWRSGAGRTAVQFGWGVGGRAAVQLGRRVGTGRAYNSGGASAPQQKQ